MTEKKTVKLSDICILEKGQQIDTSLLDDSKPYRYINGGIKESGYFDNFNTSGESVLISEGGASCGYINYVNEDFWCGCHCYRLHDIKVFPKYLFHALKANQQRIMALRTGSAMPNIQKSTIQKFELKIHDDFKIQQKISSMLDKCNALIDKHNLLLDKYDTLIKSRFIEMFGDPIQNPMGWEKTELGNMCKEVRYGTSKPATENGKYTYLRMNNITFEGELDLENTKTIDISDEELPKCSVQKGDILFNRTNSIELCGKTCLYKLDETMVIAGYIIRVRVNEKLNPQYVSTFFNTKSIKKLLREMAKGAVNQANINAQEMQSIQIPVPPIALQNEYDAFVQQIDKSKFAVQKSLEKAETLYKSLMQEYFG